MSDLTAEAIDAIADLSCRANGAEIIVRPETPGVLWKREGSKLMQEAIPPPRRNPILRGVPDVTELVAGLASAVIYHDHEAVRVVLDEADRREVAVMPLEVSARWKTLTKGLPQSFSPAEAIKFLRFELHSTNVSAVTDALRRLDFERKGAGSAEVAHGRETLGKSVEMRVQQADRVPEEFKVSTPVYVNPGLRGFTVEVRVGIYIDLGNEAVELRVLADEESRGVALAHDYLHHALVTAAGSRPVFNGRPS